jgi:hypothetical protein
MKALYTLVGMRFRGTVQLVAKLPVGEALDLLREPDNQHDHNAVQVWAQGQHVAYIKGDEAAGLARWMDADETRKQYGVSGKLVAARWPQVEVEQ